MIERAERRATGGEPVIRVDGLRKTYAGGADAITAVDDASFSVDAGEVVGLLGPNGAGKTTLIKSILGLVLPDRGTVRVAGSDVRNDPRAVSRSVGAMLEGARNVYWRLTVRENLRFFAAVGGYVPADRRRRHDELLDRLDLADRADTVVNELSRGMKQKVSLACTLARDTPIVVLDEPTLGLDVESSRDLRTELRRLAEAESRTVLVSSHDMDVVEALCDRVIVVRAGRIVADDSVAALRELFRTQVYRVTVSDPPPELRDRIERHYRIQRWSRDGDQTAIELVIADSEAFYDLVALLRRTGCVLHDVTSLEPDLEDVFLRLIGRDEGQSSDLGRDATDRPRGAERSGADGDSATADGGDRDA
ncbi:ABC transporter ATP-binding protein [Halosolutus gelatinilyticus]|uniref:ABC transporter ATP-binding protein n=1 Tax=Halosolutus gelatinilyticus TaxID=2931975 RepID=UPI001FF650EC|nr:ABC transporter ATP-binding protein [Halosolutus gelatinilyticus]